MIKQFWTLITIDDKVENSSESMANWLQLALGRECNYVSAAAWSTEELATRFFATQGMVLMTPFNLRLAMNRVAEFDLHCAESWNRREVEE